MAKAEGAEPDFGAVGLLKAPLLEAIDPKAVAGLMNDEVEDVGMVAAGLGAGVDGGESSSSSRPGTLPLPSTGESGGDSTVPGALALSELMAEPSDPRPNESSDGFSSLMAKGLVCPPNVLPNAGLVKALPPPKVGLGFFSSAF